MKFWEPFIVLKTLWEVIYRLMTSPLFLHLLFLWLMTMDNLRRLREPVFYINKKKVFIGCIVIISWIIFLIWYYLIMSNSIEIIRSYEV